MPTLQTVKHTQASRRQQPTNCLSVFDQFMGLVLKGLIFGFGSMFQIHISPFLHRVIKLYDGN